MVSSSPWNPSPRAGRRLAELLEERQEPFLLEDYLMENGCSGRIIVMRSQAAAETPLCWSTANEVFKRLRRLGSHGGTAGAVFLKRSFDKLFYSTNGSVHAHQQRRLSTFTACISEDLKQQVLSPVSVLELHSAGSSPFHSNTTINDSELKEAFITFEVAHHEKKLRCAERESRYNKGRKPVLDSVVMFRKAMDELILFNIFGASDFSSWREEWSRFNPHHVGEICLFIEAAIFDDLSEEAVLDMLISPPLI